MDTVVIVGAGLAGARASEVLRREGYTGHIVLIGAEPGAPYDRPPLTKAVLAGKRDETTLPTDWAALDVDTRFSVTATALRVDDRTVLTDAGEVAFDGLVIATGADPITLPGDGRQHVVRTLGDALALRVLLTEGARVVIVGASWIGAEVATAALAAGCSVTCIEAASTVSHTALGEAGTRLEAWWEGVDLRLDTSVERIDPHAVHLVGEELPADVVVVGVGVRPSTGWLHDSGLELDHGVVVDERLRAAPGVVAIGDVAAWWSTRFGRRLSVEHWDNAAASAAVAVPALLGVDGPAYDPIPYFWSDQFGHKVQYLGAHDETSRLVHRPPDEDGRWGAAWLDEKDRVDAMLIVDRPRDLGVARKLIASRSPVSPEQLADPRVPLAKIEALPG